MWSILAYFGCVFVGMVIGSKIGAHYSSLKWSELINNYTIIMQKLVNNNIVNIRLGKALIKHIRKDANGISNTELRVIRERE